MLDAFTAAIARHGRQRADLYRTGHAEVVPGIEADEVNLLNAGTTALRRRRWLDALGSIQCLRVLYRHLGRQDDWEIALRQWLAEPAIGERTSDAIEEWRQLLSFQVELARSRRDWNDAEWLIRTVLEGDAAQAEGANTEDAEGRDRLRRLAASLTAVGDILRERGDPQCQPYYEQARSLLHSIDAHREAELMLLHLVRQPHFEMWSCLCWLKAAA